MNLDPELIKIIGQILGQIAVTVLIEVGRAGLRAWQTRAADGRRRPSRRKTKRTAGPRRRRRARQARVKQPTANEQSS